VLAVRLPYESSSPDSLEDAGITAEQLGVRFETFEITSMVEALIQRDPKMTDVRKGNLLARARMIVLYDQSEAFHGLVLGTSNKTEILLGYTTLWGDMASALNPLGDLYKTQLRQLGRALQLPQSVLDKPPSADLWAGQTDEAELGMTYEQVDPLLYLLADKRYTPEDCVQAGFDQAFVEKVVQRMRRNQFKRIMPPIAKLSNRTVGYDFLYLRDWGT
jgi:NAD+ synthase